MGTIVRRVNAISSGHSCVSGERVLAFCWNLALVILLHHDVNVKLYFLS
jgi:hypothetical protein